MIKWTILPKAAQPPVNPFSWQMLQDLQHTNQLLKSVRIKFDRMNQTVQKNCAPKPGQCHAVTHKVHLFEVKDVS